MVKGEMGQREERKAEKGGRAQAQGKAGPEVDLWLRVGMGREKSRITAIGCRFLHGVMKMFPNWPY